MKEQNIKRKKRAAKFSISTAVFLALAKIVVFILSGSLAVLASALDSILDSFVSLGNLLAIKQASKPPDKEHSYGHGKIEAMASLAQAVVIFISGIFLGYSSVIKIYNPEPISHTYSAIFVMIFSIVATFFLSRFLAREAKGTDSSILKADWLHFATDMWSNAAVIAVLIIESFTNFTWLDPVVGLFLALYICYASFMLAWDAFNILTDHELTDVIRDDVIGIIQQNKIVKSYHKLRTRRSGSQKFIDFHLVFDDQISLKDAHTEAQKIIDTIEEEIPESHVLVHLDTD